MSERKRIYIVVKTYPTISETYSELVCTAGIMEDGSWIRLYPVPFRLLSDEQKYSKYTWINVNVEKNHKDFRPESYRPFQESMQVEPKAKKVDWNERRRIIFGKQKIYTNISELIQNAKEKRTSLAIFRPTEIVNFIVEKTDREWDLEKLKKLEEHSRQLNIFKTPEEQEQDFKVAQKIPYKFSYKFRDDVGRESTLMIEDWEIGMLYLKCLEQAGGDEQVAVHKVAQKYYDSFLKKDLHFFLGTTLKHHNTAKNPFLIIGVFYPPKKELSGQISMFDSEF